MVVVRGQSLPESPKNLEGLAPVQTLLSHSDRSPWKLLLGTFWRSSKTLATCFPPCHFFLKAFPRGRIRCSCDISAVLRCEDLTVRHCPFWPFSRWSDYEPGQILSFNIRAHVSMTRHLRTLRGPMLRSSWLSSQLAAAENFNVIFVRVDGLLYLCSPCGDLFDDGRRCTSRAVAIQVARLEGTEAK